MKLSIISDTHFGDPNCTLVNGKDGKYNIGSKYADLKSKIGKDNDYLVLVGDIFDCSIVSYNEIFEAAGVFFRQIKHDKLAKEIIYIPGNHDFNLWVTLEEQMNVINRMKNNDPPRSFHYSLPGVFDDRITPDKDKFKIPGISINTNEFKYGGLFLDQLTGGGIPFNVVYPNLYLIDKNGESYIITHGHYLDSYWSLLGDLLLNIADDDLENEVPGKLNIREMVAANLPLNLLASSSIGQADILTDIVRRIQREIKDKEFARVEDYLDKLDDYIDKQLKFKLGAFDPKEWFTDILSGKGRKIILEGIKKAKDTRYNKSFIKDKKVRKRFKRFYLASLIEIENLRQKYSISLTNPKNFIFGHTHQPISFINNKTKILIHDRLVYLHNTGGWLNRKKPDGRDEFCGAEVFIYDENGMRSDSIE